MLTYFTCILCLISVRDILGFTKSLNSRLSICNVRPDSHLCSYFSLSRKMSHVQRNVIRLNIKSDEYDIENSFDHVGNLRIASQSRNIAPEVVKTAIDQLESSKIAVKCSELKDKWELIYSTIIPGGYFPVTEICDFYGYTINSSWGFLSLGGFTGRSEIISESNPAVIQFSSDIYRLGEWEFKLNNAKSRSYTFLYVDEHIAVARSSSGGGTLLKRVLD